MIQVCSSSFLCLSDSSERQVERDVLIYLRWDKRLKIIFSHAYPIWVYSYPVRDSYCWNNKLIATFSHVLSQPQNRDGRAGGGYTYPWNEYVTIAVNRNLSNCEKARKKGFRGVNGIRTRGLCVSAAVLYQPELWRPIHWETLGSRLQSGHTAHQDTHQCFGYPYRGYTYHWWYACGDTNITGIHISLWHRANF